ncbi:MULTISPECIES: hypothetical protein [unclassified Moorena]|nr:MULTISPECIES: hypothetical protein [unclassified Moorena]
MDAPGIKLLALYHWFGALLTDQTRTRCSLAFGPRYANGAATRTH